MDLVLTPQRIWLYYPKRIRTIKRRMASKTFFEEEREMQQNVFKIHDASIIAVKDYNGPTLANIVMVVDKDTKPMDMQIVQTMAYHKVYYRDRQKIQYERNNHPSHQTFNILIKIYYKFIFTFHKYQ